MTTNRPLAEQVWAVQRQAFRLMERDLMTSWLSLDLTMAQWKALSVIWQSHGITVGRLGKELRVGLSSASALADRLVQLGLVARADDPVDRRRTLLTATESGEQLVTRLRQGSRSSVLTWLERMPEDDLRAMLRGLQSLVAVAGAGDQQEPVDTDEAVGESVLSAEEKEHAR